MASPVRRLILENPRRAWYLGSVLRAAMRHPTLDDTASRFSMALQSRR